MTEGKIIKGIAGFYYVHSSGRTYECKAKGIFRKDGIKPLVGDNVLIDVISDDPCEGNITDILPRKNELIRPACSNIDQAVIVFAVKKPDPNFNLLDRFLILMHRCDIPCIICFNKLDIASEYDIIPLGDVYEKCGHRVLFTSGLTMEGIGDIKEVLSGKTSVLAGPSGVGKSTMVNILYPDAGMETGHLSIKTDRGKHTTRHAELFYTGDDTFIMDTPGFTSLSIDDMDFEDLSGYYPEFAPYESRCRFSKCSHINEPDCGVKDALLSGEINRIRYDNYRLLYEGLKDRRR